MYRLIFIFFILLHTTAEAQVFPVEGSQLHYRLIGFRFPARPALKTTPTDQGYKLEIAAGKHERLDSFNKHIIKTAAAKNNKIIAEVPFFGMQYTWRITRKGSPANDSLHHFSTLINYDVDTTYTKMRTIQKAIKYKDAFVFMDATRALYDMNGKPVWFLPKIHGRGPENSLLKDIKITAAGTITLMYENLAAYEIDWDGNILWETPSGKSTVGGDNDEHFHHEFTRLSNGHYMVMGSEIGMWDKGFTATNDSRSLYFPGDPKGPDSEKLALQPVPFGTIIEYDKAGKVVWYWKSSKYLKNSDLYFHKNRHGYIEMTAHANSFFFDEKKKFVYVSLRDLNRLVKVKYPEGTVAAVYGQTYTAENSEVYNGMFCRQHSVKVSKSGLLYVFNNNTCYELTFPKVVMMQETGKKGELKKIWEYQCTIEGQSGNQQKQYQFTFGGNVEELANGDIFTSMSTLYSKVFIVTKDKKELWSAIPESWNDRTKTWENIIQYKASFIPSGKDLEKLIWNSRARTTGVK